MAFALRICTVGSTLTISKEIFCNILPLLRILKTFLDKQAVFFLRPRSMIDVQIQYVLVSLVALGISYCLLEK